MKIISIRDLKDTLTLLLPSHRADKEGGYHESWEEGPSFWAFIYPLWGGDSFHPKNPGGPMALSGGYTNPSFSARYRAIIRAAQDIPSKASFLWHLPHKRKRLLLASQPVLVQNYQFLSMTVVEEKDA